MFIDRVAITFDAGHRLLDYVGKCASPHGHTFTAEIHITSHDLNAVGLIVDFGDVKTPLKRWIDEHWDHGFLLNDRDAVMIRALSDVPEAKQYLFAGTNPSAEVMARELFGIARELVGRIVQSVRIWESPHQYAEYRLDDPEDTAHGGRR
ncbi:MAG: 6-pyruvoyl tetrahydropterin synthase family protein [Chloroflexota bacterium]